MRRERREGREHAPKERRGGRRGEGVVLAHYRQQCPGGGGVSGGADVEGRGGWGRAGRRELRCERSRGSGGSGASFEAREERTSGGRLACGDALLAWSLRRGQGAARTESGKNGEQRGRRGRRHLGERRGRRVRRGWRAARTKSGENGESGEVHLTRPEGGTCGGGWGMAEGSERRRGGGAWRAVHAQERAWK